MMKWTLLVFAAVISSSRGQDFAGWCPNIRNDTAMCANQHLSSLPGLAGRFSEPGQIFSVPTVVSSAYTAFCQPSARTAVQNFIDCLYGKIWPCTPSDYKKAFPDVNKAKQTFNYMCDNVNDVNTTCLLSGERGFTFGTCIAAGSGQPDLSNADAFVTYICGLAAKINPCIDTAFGGCKQRTAEVLKKAYEYQIPVGCDGCMAKPSLILLITFLVLFFLN